MQRGRQAHEAALSDAEGLVSAAATVKQDRYAEGELIRCTGRRGGLRCTHALGLVPRRTIATARPIHANADALPGTTSYQCKYCKALTEVRADQVTVAA